MRPVRAIGLIGILVGVQINGVTVNERISQNLSISGGFVGGCEVGDVEICQGSGGVSALSQGHRRKCSAAASKFVEIVVGHNMTETEDTHSAHTVIGRISEDHITVGVVGTSSQKEVTHRHAIIALTERDLAVIIEESIVTDKITAGFHGDDLRFAVVVIGAPVSTVNGAVEGIKLDLGVEV